MSNQVLRALAVACEMTGTTLSKEAMLGFDADLAAYGEARVLRALERCRREVKHRLTLADIVQRLDEDDGRLGAEEAWARCLPAFDEAETAVLSPEMLEAMRSARPLLAEGDKIAARMAFREVYEKLVKAARVKKIPLEYRVSLGFSVPGRREPIERAVKAGELPEALGATYLPAPSESSLSGLLIAPGGRQKDGHDETRGKLRQLIQELRGAR